MVRKILLFFILFVFSQVTFAQDINDLDINFFSKFNDNFLLYYINSALKNNHELKKTKYVVEQYRQQIKYAFSKELPSLSVGANYLGLHTPEFYNSDVSRNAFVLPFSASYEPDFLLKNRDKTKSSRMDYKTELFNQKSVYIALLTDLASVYTNILQYDSLIANQIKILENNEKIFFYNKKKFDCGIITLNNLNNYKKKYEDSKKDYSNLKGEQEILKMELAVLSGISPAVTDDLKYGNFKDFEYSGIIPEQIPSDIIFSRPDVMAAEAKLKKAKIDVRVARKEFFPKFSILGILAFDTLFAGNFFSWESSLALLLAGATQDIFQGGRKIANLKIVKAKYEELFENYKQVDLNAIKEVNTALCLIKFNIKVEQNVSKKLTYQINNYVNDVRKYKRGVISKSEILEKENEELLVQNEYIRAKAERLINYFTLYKAVGGRL